METELFNRQYIISEKELALDGWKQFLFDNYHVYVHPNLDYVHQDGKHLSVAVLGYLFDYRNTEYTTYRIKSSQRNIVIFSNRSPSFLVEKVTLVIKNS